MHTAWLGVALLQQPAGMEAGKLFKNWADLHLEIHAQPGCGLCDCGVLFRHVCRTKRRQGSLPARSSLCWAVLFTLDISSRVCIEPPCAYACN